MTKTLQEIKAQMKRLAESTLKEETEKVVYLVSFYDDTTEYSDFINNTFYTSYEEAQKAAEAQVAKDGYREDVLSYWIDTYTFKKTNRHYEKQSDSNM